MKRKFLTISMTVIAITAAGIAFSDLISEDEYRPYSGELSFTPSDMTKANDNFVIAPSTASWKTTDISKIKQTVVATFRGNVVDIGQPIDWFDNVGVEHGAIPITIDVTENTKDLENRKFKKGDLFTFYVDSTKIDGKYYISSHEPEFEIGKNVIVHIGKADLGPMGAGGDNYFVELGDFGKYKVKDGKAFNKKFPDGRNIEKALRESQ